MDMMQFIIMLIAIVGLWFWNRTESRADARRTENKLEENRKEANDNRKEMTAILHAIQQEMKDFHGRLCAIEERRMSETSNSSAKHS